MWRNVFALAILFLAFVHGMGHPMPHSIYTLDVKGDHIMAELKVPLKELQYALPFDVTEQTANLLEDGRRKRLADYFLAHIRPRSNNGLDWRVEIVEMALQETAQEATGKYQELTVYLSMQPPPGGAIRDFMLHYDAVIHQVVTHKVFVTLRGDWQSGRTGDAELNLGMIELSIADNTVKPMPVYLDEGSRWKGFVAMVWLGIDHIAEGTDHLLFLLVLLLPATLTVENRRWASFAGTRWSIWSILKIVSAFTIGHSLSLLLGSMQWVVLPPQPVEIAIAITILVTALHAIRPLFPHKEMLVATAFGLVHGLAFSTVLSDMHLAAEELAYSILGYNIGIELMQVFVLVLTMPWIIMLSKNNHFHAIRIVGAIVAIIASGAWLMERATMAPNDIASAVESIARHGKWFVFGLFGLSLFSALRVYRGGKPLSIEAKMK